MKAEIVQHEWARLNERARSAGQTFKVYAAARMGRKHELHEAHRSQHLLFSHCRLGGFDFEPQSHRLGYGNERR